MQLIDDFITTKHNIELLKMKLQKEKSKAAGAVGGAAPPVIPTVTVPTGTGEDTTTGDMTMGGLY